MRARVAGWERFSGGGGFPGENGEPVREFCIMCIMGRPNEPGFTGNKPHQRNRQTNHSKTEQCPIMRQHYVNVHALKPEEKSRRKPGNAGRVHETVAPQGDTLKRTSSQPPTTIHQLTRTTPNNSLKAYPQPKVVARRLPTPHPLADKTIGNATGVTRI